MGGVLLGMLADIGPLASRKGREMPISYAKRDVWKKVGNVARFHRQRMPAQQTAAWEGPFAPPAPSGPVVINPMVRTAAELVAPAEVAPVAAPAVAAVSAAA